ncbi:tRNA 2-thiocytidine biosynthesis TtcA family protein [Oceanirhabdus seepicola]|uniref:tRNA 2-thiocytidine biosynthesis protein TtcA n=1 Tax=Oceanirhabdus seepicola TaxID=2828781 RepID=A0A9J6P2Q8_9CLOT|nr:ATP-binding protein [Oceanirhabdus seepicola]MCM1990668.1 tRNA 2-thiocytidine biosynthesis protein TtcA [Oceanirhabdus seepicola]
MSNLAGSGCEVLIPFSERKPLKEIERSLIKKYRKEIWTKFIKAIKDYDMIQDGDKIAVTVSGGKDSLLLAKCFQELRRHGQVNFELEFIAMDPGFNESNRELLISNCEYLDIPVTIFKADIFNIVDTIAKDYPCYMCARMRRGALYAKAEELGCNKMALGHHFNDVIETTMLNVLYSGNFKTMMPKLKSTNFNDMELIRPLYYIEEDNIKRFTQNNGLFTMNCGCIVAAEKTSSKRKEMKDLIAELKKTFNDVDKSIFKSATNVNLDAVLGYKTGGEKISFMDNYDD